MSDSETLQPRSEPMDGSVRNAERYAHGSVSVAKLIRAVEQMKSHAINQAIYQHQFGSMEKKHDWEMRVLAYSEVLRELEELSECDAARSSEGRKPNA